MTKFHAWTVDALARGCTIHLLKSAANAKHLCLTEKVAQKATYAVWQDDERVLTTDDLYESSEFMLKVIGKPFTNGNCNDFYPFVEAKKVYGFNGTYTALSSGKIVTTKGGHEIATETDSNGDVWVKLKSPALGAKRLQLGYTVARMLLYNPYDMHSIVHLDGNKLNNRCSNLDWAYKKIEPSVPLDILLERCKHGNVVNGDCDFIVGDVVNTWGYIGKIAAIKENGNKIILKDCAGQDIDGMWSARPEDCTFIAEAM